MFKDLHGHPVLKGDVGHVGSVLSPYMVGFMKPGKSWKNEGQPGTVVDHRPVDFARH